MRRDERKYIKLTMIVVELSTRKFIMALRCVDYVSWKTNLYQLKRSFVLYKMQSRAF